MKPLKLFVFGIVLILASTLQAQVSVNVSIGPPPPRGPVGYSQVRYYYLPDMVTIKIWEKVMVMAVEIAKRNNQV
jgi:hypothetical protein